MKKKCTLAFWMLLVYSAVFIGLPDNAMAQESKLIEVAGTVVDEASKPVVGASVQVKGTNNAVATSATGAFSFRVPANAVLVISNVGYASQEVPVTQERMKITLKQTASDLDQVVVVGYGTVKKKDLTGAVTGISEKDIKSRPVANALDAMQGKVAGVDISTTQRPGTVASINIRGVRSLTASNSPLFVVDGIPLMSGGIEYINPSDIEAIDVLKDASATAIYGSRGANGVVIVTTKQGKAGRTSLNLDLSTTFETLKDNREMMNASEYITFRRWAYYYKDPTKYPRGDKPTIANDKTIFLATGDPTAWANIAKGWASGTWDGSKVATTDWYGMVTQPGLTKNLNLSVSGGSDKVKAYASFGYLDNKGTQKGQGFKRYAANVNVDIKATRWFSMGSNLQVSYSVQEYGQSTAGGNPLSGQGSLYEQARTEFPYAQPYDSAGNRILTPGGDIGIKNIANEWLYNQDQRTTLRAFGSLYGQVDFGAIIPVLKDLKYRVNFGPDFSNYRDGTYIDALSVRSAGTNYAALAKNQAISYTLDHLIYYNKSIGRHDFGLTLLGSQTQYTNETSNIAANGVAFASQKWNALSKKYISAAQLADYSSGWTKNELQSYMGRINYSFNDRYLLTASIRRDGASQLAEGHKYSWFPSAALAWRIKQEHFMNNVSWLDDLKLRLGVGVTGNSAISAYATQGAVTSIFYPYISTLGAGSVPSTTMANQNLGWEKTTQYNGGIDFSMLNRRVNGSVDVYTSRTTDLLLKMSIPTVTGYTDTYANVGETANKGVDLSLTTVNITTKDFNWTTTASVSWQKDRIVKLATGSNDINNGWFIGQPASVIYGYQNSGLWQAADSATYKLYNAKGNTFSPGNVRPVDMNGDTAIDATHDRVVIGSTRPQWIVGMTNTFAYKGIELSIFLYGRLKYLYDTGGESETARGTQRVINYYTETNTNAEYQKPIYTEGTGDPFYQALGYKSGSFIKIRNISLAYNLDSRILKTNAVKGLKIYAQMVNPGMLFSKIKWIDMDLLSAPYNKGITIGLNATF
ncbi:SusC/RagA family TonB-linked outer membrane protein [Niabella soli]|uniref:TonB-linked outer membrane protein n=1 Tax=Niabella soli DSM 19437 TaxID=929713 RepID=W0EWG7_9BACT|nr:TonB-dependent receptor [Niabella soli]AHF15135.1 TonB-linked outer membrane protein [Niabella soli DSM 19437]